MDSLTVHGKNFFLGLKILNAFYRDFTLCKTEGGISLNGSDNSTVNVCVKVPAEHVCLRGPHHMTLRGRDHEYFELADEQLRLSVAEEQLRISSSVRNYTIVDTTQLTRVMLSELFDHEMYAPTDYTWSIDARVFKTWMSRIKSCESKVVSVACERDRVTLTTCGVGLDSNSALSATMTRPVRAPLRVFLNKDVLLKVPKLSAIKTRSGGALQKLVSSDYEFHLLRDTTTHYLSGVGMTLRLAELEVTLAFNVTQSDDEDIVKLD